MGARRAPFLCFSSLRVTMKQGKIVMSVKPPGEREFLRSLFLSTGDSDVLDMLERGERKGFRGILRSLGSKLIRIAPVAIVLYAVYACR
jgi:hypothetical protein